MKSDNVLNLIKEKNLQIPKLLINNYRNLKITEKELILLIYLLNQEKNPVFDPLTFGENLNWDITEVMETISSLCDKKIIDLVVKKQNKNKEYVDINNLYEKLLMIILDEQDEEETSPIYTIIEQEFGRTLSPIEYETISNWLNSNISEDLIKEAIKEAVLNGAHRLNYIDKILSDWTKKGYKNISDIKRKNNKKDEKKELFEYDWLAENE